MSRLQFVSSVKHSEMLKHVFRSVWLKVMQTEIARYFKHIQAATNGGYPLYFNGHFLTVPYYIRFP